jgi:hypothetical protein
LKASIEAPGFIEIPLGVQIVLLIDTSAMGSSNNDDGNNSNC